MLRQLFVCAVLLQPGCATILGHSDHSMKVTSTPSGASVYLNGAPVGETPVEFAVEDLGTPNTLKVRLSGHEDESERILRKVQTVAFCNLFNLICWGVDYLSDSMFEIKNDVLHFDLRTHRPAAVSPAGPTGVESITAPTAPVEAVPPETLVDPAPAPAENLVPPPDLPPPPLVPPPTA